MITVAPRIYPSLPQYTPLFNNYMRRSQNLPLPLRIYPLLNICMRHSQNPKPRIYPLFSTTICDSPKIYSPLLEYTPILSKYMRHPHNLALSRRIYNTLLNIYVRSMYAMLPQIISLSQYINPFSITKYIRHSAPLYQYNIPLNIYSQPSDNLPPSQNLPLHSRIYPLFLQLHATFPESTPIIP